MAQITYADKTALYQNEDVAAENKVRDVDMNEIKQVVNDNETKILLDVTDTAPAECSTGDMYFNTTDNLIYTATATDTWSSTGVAPTENTIYVVLTTQTSYMYDGNTLVSVGGGASGGGETLPVGSVLEFPTTDSTKVPDGWLFCDGSAVSRTTYADLFALIGTSFGSGDGSTTFNLPTKEGLVSVGVKSSDTDFDTIGKTGGEKTHTLILNEIPAHSHSYTNNPNAIFSSGTGSYSAVGGTQASSTGSSGGGQAHNNLQPYLVTNFIIKATQTTPVQAEVVNDYSTSQKNAYSCSYANKVFDGTMLWTNPDPTADFDSQNITLSTGDYDFFEILYTTNDKTSMLNTGKIKKGFNTLLQAGVGSSSQGPYNFFRSVTYTNDTTFNVGVGLEAYASQRPTNAGVCIPLYVIGYKTGLFN